MSRTLTDREQAFTQAYVSLGGKSAVQAAAMAGYAGDRSVLKAAAHKVLSRPAVQEAIRWEAERRLVPQVLLAAEVLLDILGQEEHPHRFRAACALLDYSGVLAPRATPGTPTEPPVSEEAARECLARLAIQLNLAPESLLGAAVHHLQPQPEGATV